jgi:amidohydrolase
MTTRSKETLSAAVRAAIEARRDEIIATGRHIWKHPEPGYREHQTSAFLAEKLRSLGLPVKTGLAITGLRADLDTGRPGPVLAILGELDSLIIPTHPECDPATGAVHACGHNASATALFGTAAALVDAAAAGELCGKVAFIATPAEEGIENEYRQSLIDQGRIDFIAGKPQLIREGVFDDVDLSFMHHLGGKFGVNDHNGAVNKRIVFHGKSCHAASPQNGVNALNAVSLAQHAIGLMREAYSNTDKIRIHGIVTNGGAAVNVLPDTAVMEYMLRAPSVPEILALNERFDRVVLHAALAAECTATIQTLAGYMPLLDDTDLIALEQQVVHSIAPDAPFDANTHFYASCTDMGDVATVIPAIHAYVPGADGASHGVDYRIADENQAYIVNSLLGALMAVELLYGDGEKARAIAAHKSRLMPIPEYLRMMASINKTVDSSQFAPAK